MNPSLFSSEDYVRFRFEYPENLFHSLRAPMSPVPESALQVLDLGCGTGLVTESFLKSYSAPVEMTLFDPDAEMLRQAERRFIDEARVKSVKVASAENIPLGNEAVNLVLIGSAWHWMNPEMATAEIERVLMPHGCVSIFEYQFPKTKDIPALNDWIRQRFNGDWKPATQVPRGSLKELTEIWRRHPQFHQVGTYTTLQERSHHAAELAGVIVSQSRYQHFAQAHTPDEQFQLRLQLERDLDVFLDGKTARFNYSYESFLFKKRV